MWPAWGKSMAGGGSWGERWVRWGRRKWLRGSIWRSLSIKLLELTYQSWWKWPQSGLGQGALSDRISCFVLSMWASWEDDAEGNLGEEGRGQFGEEHRAGRQKEWGFRWHDGVMKGNRQNLVPGNSGKCFEGEQMFWPRKEAWGGGKASFSGQSACVFSGL